MPDPTAAADLVNSRLADTAPALIGVAVILCILLPPLFLLARMLVNSISTNTEMMRDALNNNTTALERIRDKDDTRTERHFAVLRELGEHCLNDHKVAAARTERVGEKVDALSADLRSLLGKAPGR